tara:strand:- start:8277 stop:9335 length:1059 start_codon:yes stop_codon:yes gene_type:complete
MKHMIIFVHGVGNHTLESFKKECIVTLDWIASQYHNVPKISDAFDIRSICYDTVFDKVLANARKSTANLSEAQTNVLKTLKDYQDVITEDTFWTENALDAMVYKTFLADAVDSEAAEQFYTLYNETVKDGNVLPCHVICHSLGTSVMHNVFQRLYATRDLQTGQYKYLDPIKNSLASITMLANVSRLFPRPINPYHSVVKPGPDGICNTFIDARHTLDPIPTVRPFKPQGYWDKYALNGFKTIEFADVIDLHALDQSIISISEPKLNVHAVQHYLTNPDVHQELLKGLFGSSKRPSPQKAAEYRTKWKGESIESAARALENRLERLDLQDGLEDENVDLTALLKKLKRFFDN